MTAAISPWTLYGRGLRARRLAAEDEAGSALEVPLRRWLGDADAVEEAVLRRARAPVLDVGCGPGRHVLTLKHLGLDALGVDASGEAVALARERGARVLHGSVFTAVDGAFATVLLLDGNLGIGGDPLALLRRARDLLVPGGTVLAELARPGARTRRLRLRLRLAHELSAPFPWAVVSAGDVAAFAQASGFAVPACWQAGGRWFAELRRC